MPKARFALPAPALSRVNPLPQGSAHIFSVARSLQEGLIREKRLKEITTLMLRTNLVRTPKIMPLKSAFFALPHP